MTHHFLSSERYGEYSVSIRMHPGRTDETVTLAGSVLSVSLPVSFNTLFAFSPDEMRLELHISATGQFSRIKVTCIKTTVDMPRLSEGWARLT